MHVKDSLGRKPASLLGLDVMGMDLVWRLFSPEKIRQNSGLALGNGLTLEGTDNAKANADVIEGALLKRQSYIRQN
jgi:hypothetical protein